MENSSRKGVAALLWENPPDLDQLKEELEFGDYTPEQVTGATLQYLDDCFCEGLDEPYDHEQPVEAVLRPQLRSAHIPDVLKLLLEYGMEPNAVYDGDNVMRMLKYIDNGYVAADTLAFLFEHGGTPNIMVDGEDLFDIIDFDVIFDTVNQNDRRRYDALVYCWFVYLGYGAKLSKAPTAVDTFDGFDLSELKQHRNFTFALTHTPNRGEKWSLHIIDRRDFWEVARL